MMTISYENTAEDAFAWDYYHQTQTRAGRQVRYRVCFARSLFMASIYVAVTNLGDVLQGRDVEASLVQLEYAAIAFVFFFGWSVINFKSRLKGDVQARIKKAKHDLFLGKKEIGLLQEGLRIAWDGGYAVRNWSTLANFSQTETHFVFFYGDANFLLIPKRAFRDSGHQQEFVMAVERYQTGAGVVTASGASPVAASPGAPWWRNRSAVDTSEGKQTLQQRNR